MESVYQNKFINTPSISHDITINKFDLSFSNYLTKRIFDVSFSLLAMIVLAPLFIFLWLATLIFSRNNPIYKQVRIGKNSKPFFIYKFRSMVENAENGLPILVCKNDPRITTWGRFLRKTHLDELPQFYNVIKGDMSVVGPRPERKYFIHQILEFLPEYSYLLQIKPGITSIGQIKFGYAQNVEEMIKRAIIDLDYLKKISTKFDLKIIRYTIIDVLCARGF